MGVSLVAWVWMRWDVSIELRTSKIENGKWKIENRKIGLIRCGLRPPGTKEWIPNQVGNDILVYE